MAWEITCRLWENEEANTQLKTVVDEIAAETEKLIPSGPPTGYKPIVITHDPYYTHRIYQPLDPEVYKIGIAAGKETPGKAVYDFAHELMHIYIDVRVINWFTEIISHLASFYFLDLFADKWAENPPRPEFSGYAAILQDRKNDIVREAYQNVDLYQNQVSGNWIREEIKRIAAWEVSGTEILYNLIALDILPLFRENPEAWQMIPFIGKSTLPPPPEDPSDLTAESRSQPDFYTFLHILPGDIKPFGEKLVARIWNG